VLGAAIRLNSDEQCEINILPPGWVRVKKTRWGFWGRRLFLETEYFRLMMTANTLNDMFPDNLLPPHFPADRFLVSFANAVLHCNTADQVARVLNDARARSGSR
jgi:hypothetical protein